VTGRWPVRAWCSVCRGPGTVTKFCIGRGLSHVPVQAHRDEIVQASFFVQGCSAVQCRPSWCRPHYVPKFQPRRLLVHQFADVCFLLKAFAQTLEDTGDLHLG